MKRLILPVLLFLSACRPEPTLQGHTYRLSDSSLPITLSFDTHTHRYSGKAVNRYFGTYRVVERHITFSSPSSTMYMGDEDDMTAEDRYFDALTRVQNYTLTDTQLTLILPDQQTLVFSLQD